MEQVSQILSHRNVAIKLMRLRNHVFHLKLKWFIFKISRSLSKHTVRTRNQNRENTNLDLDIQKVELLRGDQGMEINFESELMNLKDTELRLGLPGRDEEEKRSCSGSSVRSNKRCWRESSEKEELVSKSNVCNGSDDQDNAPPAKVQVVGWPPIRSYRKNSVQQKKGLQEGDGAGNMYVKVSMDGAPYLRKIDLKIFNSYPQLLKALQNMFKCTFGEYSEREGYDGSEHAPTYEDKDGDWMLVGDVPWNMFMSSCKRLRIMKGSEAKGLGGL